MTLAEQSQFLELMAKIEGAGLFEKVATAMPADGTAGVPAVVPGSRSR